VSDIFKMYVDVSTAVIRGAAKAGAKAGTALSGAVSDYSAGRGARRGVLAPGDPPPPPTANGSYFDFRGVLSLRGVPNDLQVAEFPVGRYVHPAKGPRGPIALPAGVVGHHAAVVGPAGSGKTTGIIVPWIIAGLRAGWSVVTIDVKGNLIDRVRNAVQVSGQPLGVRASVLDYTRPAQSVRWNWLAELDSERAIDNAVQSILGKEPPPKSDPFFFHMDSQVLRGLLELASVSSHRDTLTAASLLRTLRDQRKMVERVKRYPSSPAFPRLRDLETLYPDEYAKRIAGVAIRLDALAKPVVEAVTNRCDIRANDVLGSQRLVSVVAPVQDGQMAATLSSLFINQLLFRAYDRFVNPGGVPVLLVLDEAAQIADRVDFESLLSVAREAQIAAVIAVQDVAQFKDENQRSIIFANSGTVIYMPRTSSKSAELLSKRLGEHPVQAASMSTGPAPSGLGTNTNRTKHTQMVPVLGAREIMGLADPFGRFAAIVHAPDLTDRPFIVDLTQS
jgi:type IV secretory pathway TraG/TraD family ATPase VirD4